MAEHLWLSSRTSQESRLFCIQWQGPPNLPPPPPRVLPPVLGVIQNEQIVRVISNPKEITSNLQKLLDRKEHAQIPVGFIAILIGLACGLAVRPSNLSVLGLLSIAGGTAIYKVLHACPVCPFVGVGGVPIELCAFGGYAGLATFGACRPIDRLPMLLTAYFATLGCGTQLFLSWSNSALCLPCTVIAFCNGGLVTMGVLRSQVATMKALGPRFRFGLPSAAFGAIILIGLYDPSTPPSTGISSAYLKAPVSLRGYKLSDLGISGANSGRQIVAVLSRECESCKLEGEWLSAHPDIPVRIEFLVHDGTKTESATEFVDANRMFSQVPRTLLADNGKIISDLQGWSEGPTWQATFLAELSIFTSPSTGGKSKRETE